MAIPNLQLDNPIDLAAVPDTPLSIQLPALGLPQGLGQWRTMRNFVYIVIGTALTLFFGGTFVAEAAAKNQGLVQLLVMVQRVAAGGLAFIIACRPEIRAEGIGVVSVIAAALLVFASMVVNRFYPHSKPTMQVVMYCLLVALLVMELGFYFFTLWKESVFTDEERAKSGNDLYRQLLGIVGSGILLFATMGFLLTPLTTICGASLLAFGIGFSRLNQLYKKPWKSFYRAIANFLFYPSQSELAPGLISTPAGSFLSRSALIGVVIASALPSVADEAAAGHMWLAIGWALAPFALLLSISVLVVSIVGATIVMGEPTKAWREIVKKMRKSPNEVERNALFLGYVANDWSPTLVDRSLCFQHFHILGATGANKSSMGLAPLIEQLISFGDASVIIIDLKADSPELYWAAEAAVKDYRAEHRSDIPLKLFSLGNGTRSHMFNPFLTTGWTGMSTLERTDILSTSCGLAYGHDYGPSFFTSANSAVLRESNLLNPDAMSFRQLYKDVARILRGDDDRLLPELRRAGVHVMEVIGRLASYEGINIVPGSGYDDSVIENQIQLAEYFQKPGVAYFRLPSTTSSIGAPSIARLILYFLIIAGKTSQRKTKVHVIIDEFQRMASDNLDQMLQMARSHDIGLVLCNQSLSDLQANSAKVYHAVDGNCGIRKWFSIASSSEMKMLEYLMGTKEEIEVTESRNRRETTYSSRTVHVPRARVTDLHTISEDPNLSILQIGGSGKGYARYHGIPFVAYSNYHISEDEFARRSKMPWPSDLVGMFDTKEEAQADPHVGKTPKGKSGKSRKDQRNGDGSNNPHTEGWDQDLFS